MRTFPSPTSWAWLNELKGVRTIDSLAEAPTLIHSASVCNKPFRSSFIRDLGLRFAEGVHFEDVYFTVPALLRARRTVLVDKLVYEYRKRDAGGSIMDSLFTREKNYWDHLLAVEFLADLRRGLTDAEDEALCRFMVRSFQGFAMRAPEVLGEPEQKEFFARCVDVYASVPVDVVLTTALDLRHRISFASFLAADFDLFADRASAVSRLTADDGVMSVSREVPADVQRLLQVDRVAAHVESVRLDRKAQQLLISGRFTLAGVPLRQPLGAKLAVRVRGSWSRSGPATSAGRTSPSGPRTRPTAASRLGCRWPSCARDVTTCAWSSSPPRARRRR